MGTSNSALRVLTETRDAKGNDQLGGVKAGSGL